MKQNSNRDAAEPRAPKRGAAKKRATTARTAAKKSTALAGRQAARKTSGGKQTKAQREAAPALRPIRKQQTRAQFFDTVAADSGIERPIVERVTRSLTRTITRHLIPRGSGRVEIPYLGAALWTGRQAAQKAREMASPILGGRIVKIPSKRAQPVPRLRAHLALREAVARS